MTRQGLQGAQMAKATAIRESALTKEPTARLARGRRLRVSAVAALALLLLLAAMASAIVLSQRQSRARILANFKLRGTASATFVSTYLDEQAAREGHAARRFLDGATVSPERFAIVTAAFGSDAAVLLDGRGRALDVMPPKPSLLGRPLARRYAHLAAAERGRVAVSNVVPSAARDLPVMAVAVPFATAEGRRVFSVAYQATGTALDALVDHTISYPEHRVFLVDGAGRLVAASPRMAVSTLAAADPRLARAAARSQLGAVPGAATPRTFTAAPIPGTPWRLLIAVPDSKLYSSVTGATLLVPWIVFALVAILGALLVALLARSRADRARLAQLSRTLERTARTDSLTGLFNRRALNEQLTRLAAHARRREEPLTILMIDLDRFKETNDGFGHDAGDRVLRAVADCMRKALRADDVYGRWGGDEFLVALPNTDDEAARRVADRIRDAAGTVELGDIGLSEGVPLSVGRATAVHCSPHDLVNAADVALYGAKAASRAAVAAGDPR
jgi:diguanylate cyclase (GGDEF)-like protein